MNKPLELTLAIIKPHVFSNPMAIEEIRRRIVESQFKVVRSSRKQLRQAEAVTFYKEHEGKFFFNRLVTFMTSGPIDLYVLCKHDAIASWRRMMGSTQVYRTQFSDPNSIRGQFGLSDTRNAVHGSDSIESANREIELLFPHFNIAHWYAADEPTIRLSNYYEFDDKSFLHRIKSKR